MQLDNSPIEDFDTLGAELGISLRVKRDDLLPFPLAGNKVPKILAELDSLGSVPDVVITNGSVASNHCRTLALIARRVGFDVELVLHGADSNSGPALAMLQALEARTTLVEPSAIAPTIEQIALSHRKTGRSVHILAGGCHTRAGSIAYRDAAIEALTSVSTDVVIVASGTGATHGGIAAGAVSIDNAPRVVGFSVARSHGRGLEAVREAADWAGMPPSGPLEFNDEYLDGGYGRWSETTLAAVALGWRYGLPLDPTYTGKAFAGLVGLVRSGSIAVGSRVLFWHTGGLWNYINEQFRAVNVLDIVKKGKQ